MYYAIDTNSDIPIYKQLFEGIMLDITMGKLPYGAKLFTIRELADTLDLAIGTVKRAYEELEKAGAIRLTRGSGTFVCLREEPMESRKERAMVAIDALIDNLEGMSFSPREIEIFLDLKLRQRLERDTLAQVLIIDNSPEALSALSDQLYPTFAVSVATRLLDDALSHSSELLGEADLIVAEESHYATLEKLITLKDRLMPIAVCPTRASILGLSKVPNDKTVGVLCKTPSFGQQIYDLAKQSIQSVLLEPWASDNAKPLDEYIQGVDVLLMPENLMPMLSKTEQNTLYDFMKHGHTLTLEFRADRGSIMTFDKRVEEIVRHKRMG